MNIKLHIWRQKNSNTSGKFETYAVQDIGENTSFLEMLDILNEQLIDAGKECIAFDYDCREGICGACSLVINGYAHGKQKRTTTCQLYMREYKNQQELWIEPFRAVGFPVIKDLMVDRSSLDKIIQSGGYISVHTGITTDANTILIDKQSADESFNSATCIGCGACVAVCPNASASLFVAAKINHLHKLPQGLIESKNRVKKMTDAMFNEGFGTCSNHLYCETVCPKDIKIDNIMVMNKIIGLA